MTTITTRTNKTTELTYGEGDANVDLNISAISADPAKTDGSDNRTVYECTGTFDFTLPEASVIVDPSASKPWNDYEVTIKNAGSGVVTVKTSGTDTLDGVAAPGDKAIAAGEAFTYKVNAGKTGYISTGKVSYNAVIAAAVITDHRIVRGDGGVRGVQESGVTIDDSDNMSGVAALSTTTIELGHASDTTLARVSAGNITVEGKTIYRQDGTDVPVLDGGTGRSSATAYGVICGGTNTTQPHQSVAVGDAGQVLTSNGAGQLPGMKDNIVATFVASSGSSVNQGQTRYLYPQGLGWGSFSASESNTIACIAPASGKLKNLLVRGDLNTVGNTTTVTIRRAPHATGVFADSGVDLVISDGDTSLNNSGSDAGTVVAGDYLLLEIVCGAGAGTFGAEFFASFNIVADDTT